MKVTFRAEAHIDVQNLVGLLAHRISTYEVAFGKVPGEIRCTMWVNVSEDFFRQTLAQVPDSHVMQRTLTCR